MDLQNFLEEDMVRFLEQKQREQENKREEASEEIEEFSMDKDYEKLMKKALEYRDFYTAKKLFDEVKKKLSTADTKLEEKTYTKLLENLYTTIRGFGMQEETGDDFIKEITEASQEIQSKSMSYKDKIKKDIESLNHKLAKHLKNEDLLAATREYKKMKSRFNEFPDDDHEEKEELFKDVISGYYQIKKLEKILREEDEQEQNREKIDKQKILEETKEDVLLHTQKIKVFLEDEKVKEAMLEYLNLKNIFEEFPDSLMEEKKAIYSHIMNMYKAIKKKKEELYGKTDQKSLDAMFLVDLRSKIKNTIKLMKEKDLGQAESMLMDVKHQMHNFPQNKVKEEEKFNELIEQIETRINFLRQTRELKNE